jgi:hypothetical protein
MSFLRMEKGLLEHKSFFICKCKQKTWINLSHLGVIFYFYIPVYFKTSPNLN